MQTQHSAISVHLVIRVALLDLDSQLLAPLALQGVIVSLKAQQVSLNAPLVQWVTMADTLEPQAVSLVLLAFTQSS